MLDQQLDSTKFFLYAVNVLLQVIGERPIADDVELAEVEEAQQASSVLIEVKKEVLSEGWDFNTDDNYVFPPDNAGYISVPYTVLDITSPDGDLVVRDWRLYSKSDQSAIFTEPKEMNVIWDMDFNTLTHPLRNFIMIRAARKFQARQVGAGDAYTFTSREEEEAYLIARRSEGFTGQYNILTSEYGTSNIIAN